LSGGEGLHEPHAATDEELPRDHDPDNLGRVVRGELTSAEALQTGIPCTVQMVERSRRLAGAPLKTCRATLDEGIATNLAGGTHCAFPNHGKGYCVFNDSAIGALAMPAAGCVQRIVMLDCDVHQGNATASIRQAIRPCSLSRSMAPGILCFTWKPAIFVVRPA